MEVFLEKISAYNFLNCIIPGAVLVFLSEKLFGFSLLSENDFVNIIFIYFAGMVVGRISSLIVEPIAKKIIHFAPYKDFVEAEKEDSKLDVLSTTNNMYRTFVGVFVCLFLEWGIFELCEICPCAQEYMGAIVCVLLFLMFVFAYRKQTGYVVKRVEKVLEMKKEKEDTNKGDEKKW